MIKLSGSERIIMISKGSKMLLSQLLIVMLLITVAVGCTFTGKKNSNNPDAIAESFLRTIYQVDNHDRYERLMKASALSSSVGEDSFKEYIELYSPFMKEKALEDLFASGYATYFDGLAHDNDFTSEVVAVKLTENQGSGEAVIYSYKVDVTILVNGEEKSREEEGTIQLEKDDKGQYKISYFTMVKKPF